MKVALFSCGDSSSYSDSFCDVIGKIYQTVKGKAEVIGFTDTAGYSFNASEAVVDSQFKRKASRAVCNKWNTANGDYELKRITVCRHIRLH
jgi:flavodoxin